MNTKADIRIRAELRYYIPIRLFAIFPLLMLVGGCQSVGKVRVTPLAEVSGTKDNQRIEHFAHGKPVPRPYEILGVVSAFGYFKQTTLFGSGLPSGKTVKLMEDRAAALGADALVESYFWMHPSLAYASALAVKYLPEEQDNNMKACPAWVVIPRPAEPELENVRLYARYLLAGYGYFAQTAEERVDQRIADLADADPRLNAVGNPRADLVLLMEFGGGKGWNAFLASETSGGAQLALYSKSQNKIIWSATGRGHFREYFSSYSSSDKRVIAANLAVEQALGELKPLRLETGHQ